MHADKQPQIPLFPSLFTSAIALKRFSQVQLFPLFFARDLELERRLIFSKPKYVWLESFLSSFFILFHALVCMSVCSSSQSDPFTFSLVIFAFTISLQFWFIYRVIIIHLSLATSVCSSVRPLFGDSYSRSVTLHKSASFFPSLFLLLWLHRMSCVFCSS